MSEGRITRDDLNPNVLESLRGPQGEPGQQGAPGIPGEQGLPGNDAEVTSENIERALGFVPANEQTVANHESRLNQLESGSSNAKADVAGLNREVAYLKLKQDASERIEGGTVFADDFKGNRFGFTLDEVNSTGFKIKDGKMIMAKDVPTNYNVTDSTVVASAYSTAGNGGRKLVRLSNGWLVTASRNTSDYGIYFFVSKDEGITWVQLTSSNGGVNGTMIPPSIVSEGNKVHYVTKSVDVIRYGSFDATTVANSDQYPAMKVIDNSQTATGGVSLAIDPTNGHLHAAWASKNSTYPNSFNIRYSKSTDGGATWSTVEQVTNINVTGQNMQNPTISVMIDGKPHLILNYDSNNNTVQSFKWDGSKLIYQNLVFHGGSHAQSSATTVVDTTGTIHTTWHGRDSTNTTTDYIRYSNSSDGGANWSTMQKLVVGTKPSISTDKNGIICITYENAGSTYFIKSVDNGSSWSTATLIGTGTNPSTLADNSLNITVPPTIRMGASNILFNGNWTEYVEIPTTTATVIYNIPSTDYVGAFVQKTGGITVSATLNGTDMESEIDANEYQFVGSLATEALATLRLELSRPNTTGGENDAVTRILGGRS